MRFKTYWWNKIISQDMYTLVMEKNFPKSVKAIHTKSLYKNYCV